MYKCEYCDSVFMEYHTSCPNCGGNSWLTSTKKKQKEQPSPKSVQQEVIVEQEAEVKTKSTSQSAEPLKGARITVIFLLVTFGFAIYVLVTSDAFQNILSLF